MKMRKEVQLDNTVVALLQVGADKKGWSLKRYMENVLFRDAKKWAPYYDGDEIPTVSKSIKSK